MAETDSKHAPSVYVKNIVSGLVCVYVCVCVCACVQLMVMTLKM